MIYILGSIGSGKTSLTHRLSQDMGTKAYYEDVNNGLIKNMLQEFYSAGSESRKQVSAMLQVAFLTVRFEQLEHALYENNSILDSNLTSDGVMALNLYNRGEMDKASFNVYRKLNQLMQKQVDGTPFNGLPDISVYLKISPEHEIEEIKKRGREMEIKDADIDYYHSVNQAYQDWAKGFHQEALVTIDRDKYDFVNNRDDLIAVLNMIEEKLVELGKLSQAELDQIKNNRKNKFHDKLVTK